MSRFWGKIAHVEPQNLIVYGLAVWRISSLFVNEDGPAHIFRRIRELAGITHDDQGVFVIIPETFLAGVLSCVWCCSIWVSFFMTAFWLISPEISLKLAVPFAFSGMAIVIEKWVNR